MKKILLSFCLILFTVPLTFAQGETTMQFLTFKLDPQATGRGETATAYNENFASVTSNPANINHIRQWDLIHTRRIFNSFGELNFSFSGAAYRLSQNQVLGFYLQHVLFDYSNYPDFPIQNEYEYALALVYGRQFGEHLRGGLSFKYLKSKLTLAEATGWAVDVGFQWLHVFPTATRLKYSKKPQGLEPFKPEQFPTGFSFGLALLNMGPQVSYLDPSQKDPLPQTLRLGLAYQIVSSPVLQLGSFFDFEKYLLRRKGPEAESFYKAWFTAWEVQPFKRAQYYFGLQVILAYILQLRMGYLYLPIYEGSDQTVPTIGIGLDFKYFVIHYGKWSGNDQNLLIHNDQNIWGVSLKDISF